MALSGSMSTNSAYGRTYTFSWSATQSKEGNYSSVSWALTVTGDSGYVAERTLILDANGSRLIEKSNRVERYTGQVASGSFTVAHDANGNASFSSAMQVAVYTTSVNLGASGSWTLDTIQRASQPSCVTHPNTTQNVGTIGNSFDIYMNSKNSAFRHTVRYGFGNLSETVASNVQNYCSFTMPMSWCNQIPYAKSGNGTIYVDTYSGNTKIGTKSVGFTCSTPSLPPSFNLACEDATNTYSKVGVYVVGKSKIRAITSGRSYQYGASFSSFSYNIAGATASGSSASWTASGYVASTSNSVSVTLKDSRGYTSTRTQTINAASYSRPALALSISRYKLVDGAYVKDDDGNYAQVYYRASISAAGSNAVQEVSIDYKSVDGSDVGQRTICTSNEDAVYVPVSTEKVYTFTIKVSDKLETVQYSKQLSTAYTILDIHRGGRGLAIGKVSEKDALEVYMDAEFGKAVKIASDEKNPLDITNSYGSKFSLAQDSSGWFHATLQSNSNDYRTRLDQGNNNTYIYNIGDEEHASGIVLQNIASASDKAVAHILYRNGSTSNTWYSIYHEGYKPEYKVGVTWLYQGNLKGVNTSTTFSGDYDFFTIHGFTGTTYLTGITIPRTQLATANGTYKFMLADEVSYIGFQLTPTTAGSGGNITLKILAVPSSSYNGIYRIMGYKIANTR